jgi:hypothetical protein
MNAVFTPLKKNQKKFAGRQNPLNRSIFLYPNSQNFIRKTWGLRMSITKEFLILANFATRLLLTICLRGVSA